MVIATFVCSAERFISRNTVYYTRIPIKHNQLICFEQSLKIVNSLFKAFISRFTGKGCLETLRFRWGRLNGMKKSFLFRSVILICSRYTRTIIYVTWTIYLKLTCAFRWNHGHLNVLKNNLRTSQMKRVPRQIQAKNVSCFRSHNKILGLTVSVTVGLTRTGRQIIFVDYCLILHKPLA